MIDNAHIVWPLSWDPWCFCFLVKNTCGAGSCCVLSYVTMYVVHGLCLPAQLPFTCFYKRCLEILDLVDVYNWCNNFVYTILPQVSFFSEDKEQGSRLDSTKTTLDWHFTRFGSFIHLYMYKVGINHYSFDT